MSEASSRVFGIDLGTTYSVIAHVDETGRPAVLKNAEDDETTPSVVFLENSTNVVVGQYAKEQAVFDPQNVVRLVKREMGKPTAYEFHGVEHTPESLSALILRKLVATAQDQIRESVRDVVITVPAYFGMRERDATKKAGEIAGLTVLGIVPEPVAAAVHYEMTQDAAGRTILVYDLGGGTFDTTVIHVGDEIEVICTDGNQSLGGTNWDARMCDLLVERFTELAGPDESPRESDEDMQEFVLKAEQVKQQLTARESASVPIKVAGASARVEVSRTEFEDLTKDLLDSTVTIVERTLATLEQKRPGATVDEVLLVGGSSLMPAVRARLEQHFAWSPRLFEPNLAVAKGAAVWALSRLVNREQQGADDASAVIPRVAAETGIAEATLERLAAKTTRSVLPKAFGVKLQDATRPGRSYVHHLVAANDPLPTDVRTLAASTVSDGQTAIEVELYEQAGTVASEEIGDNNPISDGAGRIEGVPPGPRGAPVDVELSVDDEGLMRVRATHRDSGRNLDIAVSVGSMTSEELDRASEVVAGIMVSG